MDAASRSRLEKFMEGLKRRNFGEMEFHQAVYEAAQYIIPYVIHARPEYGDAQILERLTEPDRAVIFRVTWESDDGSLRANRGYRVQYNNAIRPYKGGLRFHRDVTLSIFKFLGFEQTLKNSLTGLPMGGAKGGSDFNPKGKSDHEVMRFCHALMTELARYIGPYTDIPAGDIGVGAREIAYLFGQYKRITNQFVGTLTGKAPAFGGSLIREEATGYGCVYMAERVVDHAQGGLEGRRCVLSGAGNVALHTAEKLLELGAKVMTLSDSTGFIHDTKGLNPEKLAWVKEHKLERHGGLTDYAEKFGGKFYKGKRPWSLACDIVFPCATQNEIEAEDAATLVKNGCKLVIEGANMPCTLDAIEALGKGGVTVVPSKAANAGGVAVSGLELTQNTMRLYWSREEVDVRLKDIMKDIHERCVQYGEDKGGVNYIKGANIAAFVKVADAMLAYGAV